MAGVKEDGAKRQDRRGTVANGVIERIAEMIQDGDLSPGDRLPPELELAGQLGVSRNSLREAVRALTLVNVLHVRQGDGTYVASLEPTALLASTRFVVSLIQGAALIELFAVRRTLESWAAAEAAARIDDDGLRQLRGYLEIMKSASSIDDVTTADAEFHALVAQTAGNGFLAALLDSLSGQTRRVRVARYGMDARLRQNTISEHEEIYRALALRDPELARTVAAFHVSRGETWLAKLDSGDGRRQEPALSEADLLPKPGASDGVDGVRTNGQVGRSQATADSRPARRPAVVHNRTLVERDSDDGADGHACANGCTNRDARAHDGAHDGSARLRQVLGHLRRQQQLE
jgi:GntR family transcriptional repressor for pyruvate dehydrogenase complex